MGIYPGHPSPYILFCSTRQLVDLDLALFPTLKRRRRRASRGSGYLSFILSLIVDEDT